MTLETIMACVVLVMVVAALYQQRKLRRDFDELRRTIKLLRHTKPQPSSTGVTYLSQEHEDRVRQKIEEGT